MQARLAEARAVAVNIVADNWPALSLRMHAQLMGAACDGLKRQPGEAIATSHHLPVRHRLLPIGVDLLPPAALGVETAERHVDRAFGLGGAPLDDGPIGF